LSETDMDELGFVLQNIDTLSDSFLSAKSSDTSHDISTLEKRQKAIAETEPLPDPSIWESEEPEELVFRFTPENLPPKSNTPQNEDALDWHTLRFPTFNSTYEAELESFKAIILGEKDVGKKSFLFSAGFGTNCVQIEEQCPISGRVSYSKIVTNRETPYRIDVIVGENLLSREFFANTSIMILMYSVIDRASFQSIEYWLEEASRYLLHVPPILILGNKTDLRKSVSAEANHVQLLEGINLKRALSERIGSIGFSHPVKFVEISCNSEEGVEDAIRNVVALWLDSEKIVLPALE